MKELLGYQVDEVAAALRMPTRLIECLCPKSLNFWEVKANIIGRPIYSGPMYSHVEFLIMKAMFKHLEKILQNLRQQCSKTMDLMRKTNRSAHVLNFGKLHFYAVLCNTTM